MKMVRIHTRRRMRRNLGIWKINVTNSGETLMRLKIMNLYVEAPSL